eukprot:gene15630-18570_t
MNIIGNIGAALQTLVARATTSNDQPTPGYLYVDLQNESNASIERCQQILSQLLSRLKKDSPIVKLKALKCIKHLLLKGNPTFRQDLATFTEPLHQCSMAPATRIANDSDGNSIVVFDNAPASSAVVATTGFGNKGSMTNAPAPSPTKIDGIKNKITQVSTKIQSKMGVESNKRIVLSNFGSPQVDDGSNIPIVPVRDGSHLMASGGGQNHQQQQHESNTPCGDQSALDEHYQHLECFQITLATLGNVLISTIPTTAIAKFLSYYRSASVDDHAIILAVLDDRLQCRKWQLKQKSLMLIEALLQDDQSSASVYFRDNDSSLQHLVGSIQKTNREKAKHILRHLGVEIIQKKPKELELDPFSNTTTSTSSGQSTAKTTKTTTTTSQNLMDDFTTLDLSSLQFGSHNGTEQLQPSKDKFNSPINSRNPNTSKSSPSQSTDSSSSLDPFKSLTDSMIHNANVKAMQKK